jgi:hypothetical protein
LRIPRYRPGSSSEAIRTTTLARELSFAGDQVDRILGHGSTEEASQEALQVELRRRGLRADAEAPIEGRYKGENVGDDRRTSSTKGS